MNKVQYIQYFKLHGIEELPKGESIGSMMENLGEPTIEEMVKINQMAMEYYIVQNNLQIQKNTELFNQNAEMKKDVEFMQCLEAAGVDNWEGYDIAKDMMK